MTVVMCVCGLYGGWRQRHCSKLDDAQHREMGGATGNPKQTHAEAHGKGTPPPDPPRHEAQTTRQTTGDRRQTGRQTTTGRQGRAQGDRQGGGRQAARQRRCMKKPKKKRLLDAVLMVPEAGAPSSTKGISEIPGLAVGRN